jgi:hypothetical protein
VAFTLELKISGLCLLVPDPKGKRMHALMPQTDGEHKHVVRLVYNKLFTRKEARPPGDDLGFVDLYGTSPSFGAAAGDPINLTLGREIRAIEHAVETAGGAVPSDLITETPGDGKRLASRVTLVAGEGRDYAPGVLWDYDDATGEVEMSPATYWVMENVDEGQFKIPAADGGEVVLYPIRDRIAVAIYHVPPGELPPLPTLPGEPGAGKSPPHFDAYCKMLGKECKKPPTYKRKGARTTGDAGSARGVSPYTCMLMRGQLT